MMTDTEYNFKIYPQFGKVQAEIYRVSDIKFTNGKFMEIRLLDMEFGSIFRSPNENDYIKARKWVDLQMECIKKANTK